MTEPSPQEMPSAAEAVSDAGPQQQPVPPAPGVVASQPRPIPRYYAPPPPPPAYAPPPAQAHAQPVPPPRPGKPAITISNVSLFGIVSSLLLLGALTFLAGLLVGISLGGSGGQQAAAQQPYIVVPSSSPVGTPQSVMPDQSELSGIAGTAVNDVMAALPTSFVPKVLQPAASQLKKATTQHAAQAAKGVVHGSPQASSGTEAAAAPEAKQYTVRLGTFAAKENARDLQKRMQELRYRTEIREDNSQPTTVWQVESGKYNTYGDAREAANSLPRDTVPLAIVVKHPADAVGDSGS